MGEGGYENLQLYAIVLKEAKECKTIRFTKGKALSYLFGFHQITLHYNVIFLLKQ